jgi:hypothetical protein
MRGERESDWSKIWIDKRGSRGMGERGKRIKRGKIETREARDLLFAHIDVRELVYRQAVLVVLPPLEVECARLLFVGGAETEVGVIK